MSFPTKPAFIHHGTWDASTRAHPCMSWMEQYTAAFDSRAYDEIKAKWMTSDHLLVRTTGQTDQGVEASLSALATEIYAPFSSYKHVPHQLVVYEVDDGWEMLGFATLYWCLAGAAAAGAGDAGAGVTDQQGNRWDGMNPAAFGFRYRKVEGGIRLARTEVVADSGVVVGDMLKKGLLKVEDLGK